MRLTSSSHKLILTALFSAAVALPAAAEWKWYKGDTHCHTDHSDGGLNQLADFLPRDSTSEDWIDMAKRRGMHWLVVTDHKTLNQYYNPNYASNDILLLPGSEWGGHPHGVTMGLNENIEENGHDLKKKSQSTAYLAAAQNALFAMSHPGDTGNSWWAEGEDYYQTQRMNMIEVWNVGPFWFNAYANRQAIIYWERFLNEGQRIVAIGASDLHFKQLEFVAGIGSPCTQVYARDLTQAAIIEGVRHGRVYITGVPEGIEAAFECDGNLDGHYEHSIGSIVKVVHNDGAMLRFNVKGAEGAIVQVFTNSGLFHQVTADSADYTLTLPVPRRKAWFRVEVGRGVTLTSANLADQPTFARLATMVQELNVFHHLGCSAHSNGNEGCAMIDPNLLAFLSNPTEQALELTDMLVMTNPIFVEPDDAVPTYTPRPTATPSPTPREDSGPRIFLAGYLDSTQPGKRPVLAAYVDTRQLLGNRLKVEAFAGFNLLPVELKDDGRSGDFASGDKVWGLYLDTVPGGVSGPGSYRFSLTASPLSVGKPSYWPWLTVQ